jgi:hypothetical protein
MGYNQERFNQWVIDTIELLKNGEGNLRNESEALIRGSIAAIKDSGGRLEIPQELPLFFLSTFAQYFDEIEKLGMKSNPALLIKKFGLGGKKPVDSALLQFELRILLEEFVKGVMHGQANPTSRSNLKVENRQTRVASQVDQDNLMASRTYFYQEGLILGQNQPKKLQRQNITDMIQDSLEKEKSTAETYYENFELTPTKLGYKQPS